MNEPINLNSAASESGGTKPAMDVMQGTLEKFLDSASIDAVYGKPVVNGDTLIIPAAEVFSVMGFGFGSGNGPISPTQNQGEGVGGGGGGRVLSRPAAVIIASPQGVRVEPVVDVTKLGIAALTTIGFMISMLFKIRQSSKRDK